MSKRNNKGNTLFEQCRFLILILSSFGLLLTLHGQAQLEIWEIQGTGNVSPVIGQEVITNGNVVTAVGDEYFFIQTPTDRSDNNPTTSDGLFVYTDFDPGLSVGQVVNVRGTVLEFESMTEISGFGLSFTPTGATAPLPPAVTLDASFPGTEAAEVRDFEQVEGMRVEFTAPVVAPSLGNDIAALSTSTQRPFREPGILFPGVETLPVWDGNPELFWIDPDALNQPNNRFLSVGQSVTANAVLFQNDDIYVAFPLNYSVDGTIAERDLRSAAENEITVASFNVLQLQDESDFLDIQYPKLARYIVDRLGGPDIVALQEVGDIGNLNELNFRINQLDPDLRYNTYLIQGNNNTPINCAFLVHESINDVEVSQLASTESISLGGRLHDRPPLLLEANLPTNPPTPIQVLNLHLRSLGGIEGSNSFFVRTKRHEQAISVANLIQQRQGNNLIVVGDFNAFQFSDGYVDVLSQLEGSSSLGALFPVEPVVSPPLTNVSTTGAADENYSFVFQGSAQVLDHCLSTNLDGMEITEFAYARGNADAASAYFLNPNITIRASDHDGFVVYLRPEAPIISDVEVVNPLDQWKIPNPLASGSTISIPQGGTISQLNLFTMDGKLIRTWENKLGQITLPELPSGLYLLHYQQGQQVGRVRIVVD
ncbi:MAG: endonuclease/exonuclease/phosphatase family protein [Bacteroidota bacterium]